MNIEEYKYLWLDEKENWCLVNTSLGYGIVNKKTQSALLISDDALEDAIINKMIESGSKIYEDINQAYADCE